MVAFPTALPGVRTPDAKAAASLRWGVLGTGWIADKFSGAVQRNTTQQILAVGSRGADTSRAFAADHGVERAYGSYEELVSDADVDVVYVASPHNAHLPMARLALEAGKHVLVEKPLGLNASQAQEIADLAESRGRFCMEALWTMFLPKFDVVRQILDSGVLGEIRTVLADHGEHFDAGHRILRADLAGGPMLDLGTYPVSFATWILGAPERIVSAAQPHPAGVNGQLSAILSDAAGNQAVLHTTLFSNTPTTAAVAGTDGTLTFEGAFYQPGNFTLTSNDGRSLEYSEPAIGHEALFYEAAEVARCVKEGRLESPVHPLANSIKTLRVMDEIRRQNGLRFAEEL